MRLLILGDSHSIYSFAGIAEAKIYHCGPVTMHRAARDGIWSLLPKNCRLRNDDILILSLGEIDSRMHVKSQALRRGLPIEVVVDDLCNRFSHTLKEFRKECTTVVSLSCIIPFNPRFELYGTEDDIDTRITEERIIRDRMNMLMSEMGVPFIDFRSHFSNRNGSLITEMGDGACHIDTRQSKPVSEAVNSTLGIKTTFVAPAWPPKNRAEPYYTSYSQWAKAIAKTPEKQVWRPIIRLLRKHLLSPKLPK
ncbi:hypothetical protein [Rhizobium sp. PAMB 3182]